jgi:hypothetical protein
MLPSASAEMTLDCTSWPTESRMATSAILRSMA